MVIALVIVWISRILQAARADGPDPIIFYHVFKDFELVGLSFKDQKVFIS